MNGKYSQKLIIMIEYNILVSERPRRAAGGRPREELGGDRSHIGVYEHGGHPQVLRTLPLHQRVEVPKCHQLRYQ